MTSHTGPFWDAVEGRAPLPNAAATLGLEVLDVDSGSGTIELAFTDAARSSHSRPRCSRETRRRRQRHSHRSRHPARRCARRRLIPTTKWLRSGPRPALAASRTSLERSRFGAADRAGLI